MDFGSFFDKISTECGLIGAIGYGIAMYQTWELGRVRTLREGDRKQIIADAEARTAAAIAHGKAQEQMIALLMEERHKNAGKPARGQ